MSERTLTAVETPKGKPITADFLMAMQFAAVEQFRGLSKKKRIKLAHARIEELRPFAVVASEILAQDKDELIEHARAHGEMFSGGLKELAQASDQARCLMEILSSAKCRLMVALACVGDDDGGDDGDGEAVHAAA